MSELIHTTRKWLKNARQTLKAVSVTELQQTLLDPIKWYENPESRPLGSPPITDRVTVAALLHGNYRLLAETLVLDGKPEAAFQYAYLAAAATERAFFLSRQETVSNPAVDADIKRGRGNAEAICGLLAVNEWEKAEAFAKFAEPIYYALLTGDDAFAAKLVSMLPDTPPADVMRREVYFTGVIFCKAIFSAILRGDAQALQTALEERISLYRRLPWDYTTVLDLSSVAFIKMARRRGINVSLDIAEIPQCFLDSAAHSALHLPDMLDLSK